MSRDGTKVLEAALALPERERARIAERLLSSLNGPPPSAEEQAKIDAEWTAEIERRVRKIDEGKVELIPYEQVMADVRSLLQSRKGRNGTGRTKAKP